MQASRHTPILTKNAELVCHITSPASSAIHHTNKQMIYTQYSPTPSIGEVNCYAISCTNDTNTNRNRTINTGEEITVYRDKRLHGDAVAIITDQSRVSLLNPKNLTLMNYRRAWEESIFMAIPWLGLLISGALLFAAILLSVSTQQSPKKLNFTFPLWFYLFCTLLASYPIVLVYLDLGTLILYLAPCCYLLLTVLNLLTTYLRNQRVKCYRAKIINIVKSGS